MIFSHEHHRKSLLTNRLKTLSFITTESVSIIFFDILQLMSIVAVIIAERLRFIRTRERLTADGVVLDTASAAVAACPLSFDRMRAACRKISTQFVPQFQYIPFPTVSCEQAKHLPRSEKTLQTKRHTFCCVRQNAHAHTMTEHAGRSTRCPESRPRHRR